MPVVNRIADLAPAIAEWRRDIHAHPEMLFDTHRTSALVADKLRGFGCDEVATGIGRTGVVGVIRGRDTGSGRVDRPARRHGRAADRRGDRPALRLAPPPARCTPAATTATPRCCSAPRSTSPRPATSTAPPS